MSKYIDTEELHKELAFPIVKPVYFVYNVYMANLQKGGESSGYLRSTE